MKKEGSRLDSRGWRIFKYSLLGAALLLLSSAIDLRGQEVLGSIAGTVTDPSGAVVPDAEITVTNEQTGTVARTATTNSAGSYALPDLPVSTYSVRAKKQGFITAVHSNVVLNVRSEVRVDFSLSVGAVTEQLTVTAQALNVETETATVSEAVTGTHVAEIDTNGRNFAQLATLVPGANGGSLVGSFNVPVGVSANTGINFNGTREGHNVWSVDGQENYDRGCGGCMVIVPDQDSIQELRVVTSNGSQDLGFGSGGQVEVIMRSGTKDFHGEGFEFDRNTAMDTGDFFTNAAGQPKPILKFNDWGFNVGGPIYLPGHPKKTFFFYEMDWRWLAQGTTINANGIPTAWTTGNFGQSSPVILDHSQPVTLPDGSTGYTPFQSNQLRSGMIDPNAALLAKPNFIFEPPNAANGRYIYAPAVPTHVNEQIVRIDHEFSDKTSLMFHYIRDGINQTFPTTLWTGDTYPTVGTDFLNQPQSFLLKLTRSISPTLLNEAVVGFNRQPITLALTGTYAQPSGFAITPLFPGANFSNRIPIINIGSPSNVAYTDSDEPWVNVLNTWTFRDTATKMAGNHQLTFGFEDLHYLKEQNTGGATEGNYTFDGSSTAGSYVDPVSGKVLTTPGNSFADFLLGDAYEYTTSQHVILPAFVNNFVGVWVGDTWKVRSGLTLNLALRWEGMPHAHERHNDISVFRPSLYDPSKAPQIDSTGHIVPGTGDLLNGIGLAGQSGVPVGLVDNHWTNFEPRLGFVWQPRAGSNTVIRGGAGMFYENIQGNDIYGVADNPPFSNNPQIFHTTFSNPGGGPQSISPDNVQAYDPNYNQPYTMQWSFGMEHGFGPKMMLSVMYAGSESTHQSIDRNLNQPLANPNGVNINTIAPYRGWGNIGWYENSTSSNYNSLQASFRSTDWHGLTMGLAYTYSHCLDYADGDLSGINNNYNIAAEYGNCGYDVRHMLVIHYVYSIPIFNAAQGITRTMLGGWQLSGITTLYTGSPFTVGVSGDPAEVGAGNYRANVIGNPNQGSGIHTAQDWFNTAAFAPVATGQFGDGGRNIVWGDGIRNFDFSVFKNFKGIPFPTNKEGATIQFRVEFFNLFNTTQFTGYNSTLGGGGFGAPNSARLSREIQLGAKFIF